MRSSVWTGSVVAGSAFAASLCLYCAASAQADTGEDAPTKTAAGTSVSSGPSIRSTPSTAADDTGDKESDDTDTIGGSDADDSDGEVGDDDANDDDNLEAGAPDDIEQELADLDEELTDLDEGTSGNSDDDNGDNDDGDNDDGGNLEEGAPDDIEQELTDLNEELTDLDEGTSGDSDELGQYAVATDTGDLASIAGTGTDTTDSSGTLDTSPDTELEATARTAPPEGAENSAAASASKDPADTYPTVTTALHQLSEAQSLLTAGTWGEGNLFAGIAAIAPQLMIGTAQLSLRQWEDSIDHALGFFAATEGIPIVHGIARVNLAATEFLPTVAQVSLSAAQSLLPAVSQAGASLVALEAYGEIAAAQQNAMVYATVPITTTTTELGQVFTVVNISVNGGGMVPVLLDTGSIGLVIDSSVVPLGSLGPTEDSQDICSQVTSGHCSADYVGTDVAFDVYTTTVDFGNGIVTDPTFVGVTVVEGAFDGLPFYGILGVGPNSFGPIVSSPTTALPGLLPTGALINADAGYLTFGPNPLPARVTLPGNPHTEFFLAFDGGAPQLVQLGSIDSGGASGLISPALIPTGGLPPGTTVSLYTVEDGTLIYSYTLDETNTPSPYLDPSANTYFNTGHEAFIHGPVYVDFTANEGNGAASFDLDWWGWRAPSIRLPWL